MYDLVSVGSSKFCFSSGSVLWKEGGTVFVPPLCLLVPELYQNMLGHIPVDETGAGYVYDNLWWHLSRKAWFCVCCIHKVLHVLTLKSYWIKLLKVMELDKYQVY